VGFGLRHCFIWAAKSAVDSFGRKQNRSPQIQRIAEGLQISSELFEILKLNKFIEIHNGDGLSHGLDPV
jgi:hypothetical protein